MGNSKERLRHCHRKRPTGAVPRRYDMGLGDGRKAVASFTGAECLDKTAGNARGSFVHRFDFVPRDERRTAEQSDMHFRASVDGTQ